MCSEKLWSLSTKSWRLGGRWMRMQMVFCHVGSAAWEVPQGPQDISLAGMSQVSLLEGQGPCGKYFCLYTCWGWGVFLKFWKLSMSNWPVHKCIKENVKWGECYRASGSGTPPNQGGFRVGERWMYFIGWEEVTKSKRSRARKRREAREGINKGSGPRRARD